MNATDLARCRSRRRWRALAVPAVALLLALSADEGRGGAASEGPEEPGLRLVDAAGTSTRAEGGVFVTPEKLRDLEAMPRPESPSEDDALELGLEKEEEWRESQAEALQSRGATKGAPRGGAEAGPLGARDADVPSKGTVVAPVVQTPAPVTAWPAIQAPGDIAADTGIAVSHTHVVVTTRTTIAYYDKSGLKLGQVATPTFFSPLGLGAQKIDTYFDTRSLYDSYRNRFWIAALAWNSESYDFGKPADQQNPAVLKKRRNKCVMAVSKTGDPRDGWYLYVWDSAPGDGQPGLFGNQAGDSADYPMIGVDAFGIYQVNMVTNVVPGINHRTTQVSFFPAAKLAAGQAASGWLFYDLKNPDGSPVSVLQPAVHHGTSPRTWFVSRYGSNKVAVWGLSGHLTPAQQLAVGSTTLHLFDDPSDAPQYGTVERIQMTNLLTEPLKVVYRLGRLYVTFNDAADFFADGKLDACRFTRLNVGAFPIVVTEVDRWFGGRSDIYDSPIMRVHYGFPAVEVGKNGDAVIVYGRMSKWFYPQVAYSVYPLAGPDIQPSRRLAEGQDRYVWPGLEPLPLYDLNAATVDPFDDTAVWVAAPATIWRSLAAQGNFVVQVAKVFGTKVADLVPLAEPWPSTTSVPAGGTYKVTVDLRNQGDGPAPASKVGVYLTNTSTNVVTLVGYIPTPATASGQTRTVNATFKRGTLPKGSYKLRATVDATNTVLEYSGANNSVAAGGTITLK